MNPLETFIREKYHNKIEKEGDVIILPVRNLAFIYRWNDDILDCKPYDLSKSYLERGIRLVHVYQYEWENNEESMKNFLYGLIKRQHKRTVEHFEVKEIDGKEYSDFVGKYHLFTNQDKGAAVKLGLFDSDRNELIAIAGFVHSKKYGWTWKRFAYKNNEVVSHGFYIPDELFNYFKNNYMQVGEKCVDYQLLDKFFLTDYTSGRMGFKRKCRSSAFVWLSSDGKRVTNYDFKPEKKSAKSVKNVNKENWTALEAAMAYGFEKRVARVGTVTWIYEKTDDQ